MVLKLNVFGDFRAIDPSKISLGNDVVSLLNSADYNICNFEAPIHTADGKPIKKSGPVLFQSEQSPAFLLQNRFNVILLANNHVMDYGVEGGLATIEAFKSVITVGAGNAKDAFSVRIIEVKGKRIGLCSLVQNEFGTIENKDEGVFGAAWINSLDVPDIIKEAKAHCDYLFVFPHAGVEHTDAPLPEWRKVYKHLVDWGADAVIASHPHCPQGWEDYKGKRIYYSLGNFYFDEIAYGEWWYKNIAVEITIDDNDVIQYQEHFLQFDTTGTISIDKSTVMADRISYVNQLLSDDIQYLMYINGMCEKHYKGMCYGILRGVCGVSFRMKIKHIIRLLGCMILGNSDEPYLLNVIRCESHRWVMQRALNNSQKN